MSFLEEVFNNKYSAEAKEAYLFAYAAHAGQKRKYTGEPYINHPLSVAKIVSEVRADDDMIIAALLHDVVEDTEITSDDIWNFFGDRVHKLVGWLTDVSKPEDGNRKLRKRLDLEHTAEASPDAKTIKLADLIDNSYNIVTLDPGFASVYIPEKKLVLEHLTEGDEELFEMATTIVNAFEASKGERHECNNK